MTAATVRSDIVLSADQERALDGILVWLDDWDRQVLTMGGLAGTGKSFLISRLLADLNQRVAVCAFTGKAANVLRRKGIEKACTMHKLLYVCMPCCRCCNQTACMCRCQRCNEPAILCACPQPNVCGCCAKKLTDCLCGKESTRFVRVPQIDVDLVIVDEASMLNSRLVADLESFGKKVLYAGDHGQLEAIGDNPGLMMNPDLRLEEIHRQARDSHIIKFAHYLREGGSPGRWIGYKQPDLKIFGGLPDDPTAYDVIICGFNKTRVAMNKVVRERLGYHGTLPQVGEWIICLKNNSDFGVFNGQRFQVMEGSPVDKDRMLLSLADEDGNVFKNLPALTDQFGMEKTLEYTPRDVCLFDYGSVITCHKSQGSQWDRVAVIEEIGRGWKPRRWSYTAATRAAKELHYFVR